MPVKDIRVHVGAPSSTKDDKEYRKLAAAYDDFQPKTNRDLARSRLLSSGASRETNGGHTKQDTSGATRKGDSDSEKEGVAQTTGRSKATTAGQRPIKTLQAEPIDLTELPSTGSTDSLNELNTNAASGLHEPTSRSPAGSSKRSRTQPRQGLPSPPKRGAKTVEGGPYKRARTSTRGREEVYIDDTLQAAAAISSQLWSDSLKSLQSKEQEMSEQEALLPQQSDDEHDAPPAQLSEAGVDGPEVLSPSAHNTSADAGEKASASSPVAADEATTPSHPSSAAAPDDTSNAPQPPASDAAALPLSNPVASLSTFVDGIHPDYGLKVDSNPVMSPPAPTANNRFDDLKFITSGMMLITSRLTIEAKYTPYAIQYRDYGTHERGYWRFAIEFNGVDTTVEDGLGGLLDAEMPGSFWNNMKRFVESGQAGHWVNFFMSLYYKEDAAVGIKTTKAFTAFCFGEAVPYVYMILWWASSSRIKMFDAEWVDGDELVVVRVLRR